MGRQPVYKDGAFMNGNRAPVRDILESSLTLSTLSGHSEKIPVYEPGSRVSSNTKSIGTFIDFSALQQYKK